MYLYTHTKEILYFVYRKNVILDVTLINISIRALINKYIFNIYYIRLILSNRQI